MQVFLTQSHLGIVMEYAAGGELFDRIVKAGRFSEDEARFFFQQLISGVGYCHGEVGLSISRPWFVAMQTKVHLRRTVSLAFHCCQTNGQACEGSAVIRGFSELSSIVQSELCLGHVLKSLGG